MIDDLLHSLKRVGEEALAPVRCDDGWQQEYDLLVRACRNYSLRVRMTAEDHGGMKRLFRVRVELHRPWRFYALIAASAGGAGYLAHALGNTWPVPAALIGFISLGVVLRQVGVFGGQVLTALEVAAAEHKLYSLVKSRATKQEEGEPVFEDN